MKWKVTLLASDQIGEVAFVKGLRCGLTQQAIKAALNIKFSPAVEKGIFKTAGENFRI